MASLNRNETSSKWFELRVWIREGKNLENRKLIGSNAPFVEVTCGNEIKKTSSKSNLDNVVWDEKLIFRFNSWEDLPNCLTIKVKDENTLLPNPLLGEYSLKLDKNMLMNKYQENPNYVIQDGYTSLENCNQGQLDFQILLKYCNEFEPKPEMDQQQQMNYDQNSNQTFASDQYSSNQYYDQQQQQGTTFNEQANSNISDKTFQTTETYVLPTIHVQAKPTIIEKEIEYNKPVQIKETIVHKEKPIIVEQPIIKEKHEHYRESASVEQSKQNVVTHSVDQQNSGNLDTESLVNLRQQYQQQFMDTTPVVHQQKESVQLDTEYREKPTQVHEKEVIYQQPIEIEKTRIEQVKPVVHEDIKLEKEHVYQKLEPELYQDNVQYIKDNEQDNLKENRQQMTQ